MVFILYLKVVVLKPMLLNLVISLTSPCLENWSLIGDFSCLLISYFSRFLIQQYSALPVQNCPNLHIAKYIIGNGSKLIMHVIPIHACMHMHMRTCTLTYCHTQALGKRKCIVRFEKCILL